MFIKLIALPIMLGVLGHRYYNHHDHETSYDQFKNFEERGKYFKSLIKKNKKIFYV